MAIKKFLWTLLAIGQWFTILGQPATEVYLLELTLGPLISLENPVNLSQHVGYDNQPYFLDEDHLFYSSQHGDQTEVMVYSLATGEKKKLTHSPGSEYSPIPVPDGAHFSTIILEKSGRQLLWMYNLDGTDPQILIPDLKIGYHCWLNDHLVAAFVLGTPNTLHLCNTKTGRHPVITSNIGRSLHRIPETQTLSYLDKSQTPWKIMAYDPQKATTNFLVLNLEGSEDMAWSPDGTLFMGQGSKVFSWRVGQSQWELIADLNIHGIKGITRLAVHPEGSYLALVAEE